MNSISYYFSAHFVYTVLLKPKPLRFLANRILLAIIPRHLKTMGVILALNPKDPVISGALTLGVYEKYELIWFKNQLAPGMLALDVGANIGLYSALMAHGVGRTGKVYAFEPDPVNHSFLLQTLKINGFDQVNPIQNACGSNRGTAMLFHSPDNKGDHRLYEDPSLVKGCEVEVTPIDDMISEGLVDIVKMDIQGYECYALRGMEKLLRRSPNVTIFTEFWPKGLSQAGTSAEHLLKFGRDLGFSIYEFVKGKLVPIAPEDEPALIARYPGVKYGNIILKRDQSVKA